MAIQDGGPAFPMQTYEEELHRDGYRTVIIDQRGMSLRDWFAGKALAGLIASDRRLIFSDGTAVRKAARDAYGMADAMLAQRDKVEG